MNIQLQLSVFILAPILFAWVACASVPPCASMRSWFPGTNPLPFADNLPYELSVSGNSYTPASSHIGKGDKIVLISTLVYIAAD